MGKNFQNFTFYHNGSIFLNAASIENPKKVEYLKEIIDLCSGKLTKDRNDAEYIVTDTPIDDPSLKFTKQVMSTYIFDCAMKSQLLDTAKYNPKTKKN